LLLIYGTALPKHRHIRKQAFAESQNFLDANLVNAGSGQLALCLLQFAFVGPFEFEEDVVRYLAVETGLIELSAPLAEV
jgi:hypothetical protein